MSPQFVDFDADGHLDIVAGTFSGSPWIAHGSAQGWQKPQQLLDRDGARIVINHFWNYDSKKWDETQRCDAAGQASPGGHLTSAYAWDWDGDGDLDLLLGDHRSGGRVLLRRNEGQRGQARFATTNESVLVDGQPLAVPGTVATLRMVDADGDGLEDLLCGSMGDAYGQDTGGGVYLYRNVGKAGAPTFAPPRPLLAPSRKGHIEGPMRPDAGLYMDLVDFDGDADLDLVVGAYSMWKPPTPQLTPEQHAQLAELRAAAAELNKQSAALSKQVIDAGKGLAEEAARDAMAEVRTKHAKEQQRLNAERVALNKQIEALAPGPKRESFVWFYENRGASR